MKTQNKKLAFNKASVTDLNDAQLLEIDGGTTPVCVGIIVGLTIGILIDK